MNQQSFEKKKFLVIEYNSYIILSQLHRLIFTEAWRINSKPPGSVRLALTCIDKAAIRKLEGGASIFIAVSKSGECGWSKEELFEKTWVFCHDAKRNKKDSGLKQMRKSHPVDWGRLLWLKVFLQINNDLKVINYQIIKPLLLIYPKS